jgi:hypothetical protein
MTSCLSCGYALDKRYNKKYDGTFKEFCNKKCADKFQRRAPKNQKKYGLTGSLYLEKRITVLRKEPR